nr:PREDICTED: uncharacterized protein LOC109040081 [Bemisia tabaci]
MIGTQALLLTVFVAATLAAIPNQITVHNHVDPCPGGNYPTIKTFPANEAQQNLNKGQSATYNGGAVSPHVGFGIQENGQYCRNGANPAGCWNPDNAGLQVVWNSNNCGAISTNGPFYCGNNAPDAREIVNVAASGNWPNCVLTLTRKGGARGCQYKC